MANGDFDDVRSRIHDAVYQTLIDKIRRDRFPSATMMNIVEAGMSDRQFGEYLGVLLDKVADEQFPSPDMLRRLTRYV
jgi:hypothetical protein